MFPVYKMVDTCAGEFAAATPYFYSTYEQEDEALALGRSRAVVVGSGPIRIGQGSSSTTRRCRRPKRSMPTVVASIMINSNPETVSTDFDASDRLYFEPLDSESVAEVLRHESETDEISQRSAGHPSVWGANRYQSRGPLANRGVPILGSQLDSIDLAEDRHRFEGFLRGLAIPQPPGAAVTTLDDARSVAGESAIPCSCGHRTFSAVGLWKLFIVRSNWGGTYATQPSSPRIIRCSSTNISWVGKSRSMPSAMAKRCSSPGSWSISSAPAFTPVTPSPSIPHSTCFRRKSIRSSTTPPGSHWD